MKKIEETDAIFENVLNKKEEALDNIDTALISIDTKDRLLTKWYVHKECIAFCLLFVKNG